MKKMMYTLLTGAVLSAAAITAQAQDYPYTFNYSTQPYTELSGETTLILGSDGWDDTIVAFNLPIDFKYQGIPVTQWHMDTYGGLYPNEMDMGLESPFILGVHADYEDKLGATISYQVTGATGSRIAKVEYKNVGFYDGEASEYANFQIWLYEGSNKIEYHVGPSQVGANTLDYQNEGGALIVGLLYDTNVPDTVMFHAVRLNAGNHTDTTILADPNNPNSLDISNVLYAATYPVNGSVFTFNAPSVSAIAKIPAQVSALYPNPVTDHIRLQLKAQPKNGATLTVYSVTGKKLFSQAVTGIQTDVNMATLPKGLYVLTYTAEGRRESFRVMKK